MGLAFETTPARLNRDELICVCWPLHFGVVRPKCRVRPCTCSPAPSIQPAAVPHQMEAGVDLPTASDLMLACPCDSLPGPSCHRLVRRPPWQARREALAGFRCLAPPPWPAGSAPCQQASSEVSLIWGAECFVHLPPSNSAPPSARSATRAASAATSGTEASAAGRYTHGPCALLTASTACRATHACRAAGA